MTTVRQLIGNKGSHVWTVTPSTRVSAALKLMAEKQIGAVVVLDSEQVAGIFSERDYVREIAKNENCKLESSVSEMMTRLVFFVHPDISMDDCMALMTEKRIRHLPVVDKGKLVGMVSIGDVVKDVISQKEIKISSLENYILGRDYNQ